MQPSSRPPLRRAALLTLPLLLLACDPEPDPERDAGMGADSGARDAGERDSGASDGGGPEDAGATFAPTVETADYRSVDDPDLANPERGIYYWSPRDDDPHTLVGQWLYLGDWCDRDLAWAGAGDPSSSSVLVAYASTLEAHRAAGRKVIFRPRYDLPGSDALNGCGVFQASTEERTRGHVEAIASMLADYPDVIAFIEAGYLGRWGEWNWSGYGPENAPILADPALRRAFLEHVITTYRAAGLERFVGTRRPLFARELRESVPALADGVSLYNDCFMTNDSDSGTYSNPESGNPYNFGSTAEARAYAEMLSAEAPFGGETCPLSSGTPRWASCDNMVGPSSEPARLHMSYLHGAWAAEARPTWEAGGCYEEIKRRLGYRYELLSVTHPPRIEPGELGQVTIRLANTGWARMHNPREAVLVLRSASGAWAVGASLEGYGRLDGEQTGGATRGWLPGEEATVVARFAPPPEPGTYSLRLLLPDPDRPDRIAYSVRLASTRGAGAPWDAATGENDLGLLVEVR